MEFKLTREKSIETNIYSGLPHLSFRLEHIEMPMWLCKGRMLWSLFNRKLLSFTARVLVSIHDAGQKEKYPNQIELGQINGN